MKAQISAQARQGSHALVEGVALDTRIPLGAQSTCGGWWPHGANLSFERPALHAFTNIGVCDPVYFSMSDRRRSMGLVHEWVHKHGCNFDFGYCDGDECPGGTTRSLFNADPWAKAVLDLG